MHRYLSLMMTPSQPKHRDTEQLTKLEALTRTGPLNAPASPPPTPKNGDVVEVKADEWRRLNARVSHLERLTIELARRAGIALGQT